jgi:hypothetical protein
MTQQTQSDSRPSGHRGWTVSLQSRIGLNAVNSFLAKVTGVVIPFLAKFLGDRGWHDDAIGVAVALAGLGVFLMRTPAGFIVDRLRQRRALLAAASLVLGVCYGCCRSCRPGGGVSIHCSFWGASRGRSSTRSWGPWRWACWATPP